MSDIIFIDIPFKLKDEGKKLGAKFDFTEKKWFIHNKNIRSMDFDIVELDVPYAKRQLARDNGCLVGAYALLTKTKLRKL
jgi:adenine-specific DNA methylase